MVSMSTVGGTLLIYLLGLLVVVALFVFLPRRPLHPRAPAVPLAHLARTHPITTIGLLFFVSIGMSAFSEAVTPVLQSGELTLLQRGLLTQRMIFGGGMALMFFLLLRGLALPADDPAKSREPGA